MHEGADQAYKVAMATGGADWKPLSWSANEAQLIEQRRVNREEIAMVFDVPPVLLGDLSRATFSNVEELHRMLYVTVLRPWLTFFEETLKTQLLDTEPEWAEDGLFYEFDLGEVLRGDKSAEIAAAVQAFTNGLMTLNEVRAVLNLPPIDDEAGEQASHPGQQLAAPRRVRRQRRHGPVADVRPATSSRNRGSGPSGAYAGRAASPTAVTRPTHPGGPHVRHPGRQARRQAR